MVLPPNWNYRPYSRTAVVTAPNGRKWRVPKSRSLAWMVVYELHRVGLVAEGESLVVDISDLLPLTWSEVEQRRCRDCRKVLTLDRFTEATTCSSCVLRRCKRVRLGKTWIKAEIGACPCCNETTNLHRLEAIPDVGIGCPTCRKVDSRGHADREDVGAFADRMLEEQRALTETIDSLRGLVRDERVTAEGWNEFESAHCAMMGGF